MVDENTIASETQGKQNVSYVVVETTRVGKAIVQLARECRDWEEWGDSLIAVSDARGRLRCLFLIDPEQGEWAYDETVRRLARPEVERLVARGDDLTVEETVELARLTLATGELRPERLGEIIQDAKRN